MNDRFKHAFKVFSAVVLDLPLCHAVVALGRGELQPDMLCEIRVTTAGWAKGYHRDEFCSATCHSCLSDTTNYRRTHTEWPTAVLPCFVLWCVRLSQATGRGRSRRPASSALADNGILRRCSEHAFSAAVQL